MIYQRTIFKVKQKSLYFVFILKPQKIVKKKNEHMTNNFKNLCKKNSSNIPLTCQFIDSSSQLLPFYPQKELYPPDQDCHVSIHYYIIVTNC